MGFPDSSADKEETQGRLRRCGFLGQEDTLEEDMAIHSSILVWKVPWTEKPGDL